MVLGRHKGIDGDISPLRRGSVLANVSPISMPDASLEDCHPGAAVLFSVRSTLVVPREIVQVLIMPTTMPSHGGSLTVACGTGNLA